MQADLIRVRDLRTVGRRHIAFHHALERVAMRNDLPAGSVKFRIPPAEIGMPMRIDCYGSPRTTNPAQRMGSSGRANLPNGVSTRTAPFRNERKRRSSAARNASALFQSPVRLASD